MNQGTHLMNFDQMSIGQREVQLKDQKVSNSTYKTMQFQNNSKVNSATRSKNLASNTPSKNSKLHLSNS